MTAETKKDTSNGGRLLNLWAGLFAAPVAWLVELQLHYMLVPWACSTGRHFVLHLITVAALLVAVVGGVLAWQGWRQSGPGWPDGSGGPAPRSRFMAVTGLLLSALFFFVILAQGIPIFVLNPCQQ
ncbi:MAG: hypothetical protein ACLGJB_01720 [Blastocatellia bacterium]